MPTYFVISDIHSYASEMEAALKLAGFHRTDNNHILIVCGDIFDRGDETLKVYKYIKTLPKKRRILIRGNHELSYLALLLKDFPQRHDFSNGTVKTFCAIADEDPDKLWAAYWYPFIKNSDEIAKNIFNTWNNIRQKVANSEITTWLKSNEWLNYYELNNYIFVHSFIPLALKQIPVTQKFKNYPKCNLPEEYLEYNPLWRLTSTEIDWEDATWGCPWKLFKAGFFKQEIDQNKVLVCGHWHTSDFHKNFEGIDKDYSIFFSSNLIGLDACTALTKDVNVLIIKDNKCYDKYNNELKEK